MKSFVCVIFFFILQSLSLDLNPVNWNDSNWATDSSLAFSNGRYYITSYLYGDNIYVFGGNGYQDILKQKIFNTSDTWANVTTFPSNMTGGYPIIFYNGQAVGIENFVYFGCYKVAPQNLIGQIWKFNLDSNTFEYVTTVPSNKTLTQCCMTYSSSTNELLIFGGEKYNDSQTSKTIFIYNLNTSTWADSVPLSEHDHSDPACVVVNYNSSERLYVISGDNSDGAIEYFDVKIRSWTDTHVKYEFGNITGHESIYLDSTNYIITVCGNNNGSYNNYMTVYDFSTNKFIPVGENGQSYISLMTSKGYFGMTKYVNNDNLTLYVLGGKNFAFNFGLTEKCTLFRFIPSSLDEGSVVSTVIIIVLIGSGLIVLTLLCWGTSIICKKYRRKPPEQLENDFRTGQSISPKQNNKIDI